MHRADEWTSLLDSHYHQANSLLRSNSTNRGCSFKNSQGKCWWTNMESETSTWEIKVSETWQALKALEDNNSVIILPADKGNATVVLDRVGYSNKMADLIGNGGNCKVKKELTLKTEKKLLQILGKNKDLIPQTKYRQLIQHYSKLPHIYGLPKIHMDDIPLSPIVSNRGSACHPLSCFLVEIISPLTGKSSSYVKNSAHFVERIRDAPIHSNQMVSLDVVSLFTKVPTNETLAVVRDKLAADPWLEECTCIPIDNRMEMLTFCVETTYFGMGSDIYWQEEGLAMGLPLTPVLANIYMEYFEEMALGSTSLKPSMWLRYIDDTFLLWPHQEDVQILFDHMNSIRPSIQFTMEKEQDNKLCREQGFRSSVYHKPTFTGQYLNFNSNHAYKVKKGIVCCLQHRTKTISSDTYAYQEEMISLKHDLHHNNYPECIILAPRNLDRRIEDNTRKLTTVCQPYVKGSKRYVDHMTSGRYSQVVQLSGDISSGSSHQRNSTWPRTVFTPSLAVVVIYTKVRQVTH